MVHVFSREPRLGRLRAAALAAGLGAGLLFLPLAGTQAQDAGSNLVQMPSLSPLVKRVLPAVVNISVLEKGDADQTADESDGGDFQGIQPGSPFDEFLKKFFEDRGLNPKAVPQPHTQRMALGSGFIIDPSGLVVTNNHVVGDAPSNKVTVIFQDDSKHVAKILGRDPKTDLALLKIETTKPLPYVSWGDSGHEQVGDWVVAVGNPFGLGGTVSAGIVSARGRDIHSGPYDDFLQIDAPINRGNSGGPTFNLKGEVIGINTAIYSPNGGSVGIGFAIPSNLANSVIAQLREHGKVSRGWLGVQIQEVSPAIARNLGLPSNHGALVADVTKDGPAEKAGVKQGDVIESFDGQEIEKLRDLTRVVAETGVGKTATLKVWRKGKETTLQPVIAEQPANMDLVASNNGNGEDQQQATPQKATALGLKLSPLTADLRKQLKVPSTVKGVVVSQIADSSPLADVDLQPGDVIVSVNQEPVTTPKEAVAKLKAAQSSQDKSVLLQINRHGVNAFVAWSSDQSDNG
ncbi:MAG TPA: DegQ family serine endoprotease [Stellaceae bacterium]|nr:DegQ family serine endoprotease [Stellaceae bacterium]